MGFVSSMSWQSEGSVMDGIEEDEIVPMADDDHPDHDPAEVPAPDLGGDPVEIDATGIDEQLPPVDDADPIVED